MDDNVLGPDWLEIKRIIARLEGGQPDLVQLRRDMHKLAVILGHVVNRVADLQRREGGQGNG